MEQIDIAGFPIQGSQVQSHWVAPNSTQRFILHGSIKWAPGIPGNVVAKSKRTPRSGSVALKQLSLIHKRREGGGEGGIKFLYYFNSGFCESLLPIFDATSCPCPNPTISKTANSMLAIYNFLFLSSVPSQPFECSSKTL